MKTIKNTKFTIGNTEQSFADMVKAVANSVDPRHGIVAEEMKKRLRLIDVANEGGEELNFEDADLSKLKELISTMQWAVVDKNIAEFTKAVEEA